MGQMWGVLTWARMARTRASPMPEEQPVTTQVRGWPDIVYIGYVNCRIQKDEKKKMQSREPDEILRRGRREKLISGGVAGGGKLAAVSAQPLCGLCFGLRAQKPHPFALSLD